MGMTHQYAQQGAAAAFDAYAVKTAARSLLKIPRLPKMPPFLKTLGFAGKKIPVLGGVFGAANGLYTGIANGEGALTTGLRTLSGTTAALPVAGWVLPNTFDSMIDGGVAARTARTLKVPGFR